MDQREGWLLRVTREFERCPFVSNVLCSLILTCLEKLVEVEFACPCEPKWNALFASAFFCAPAVLVLVLMINILGRNCDNFLFSFVPAIVWLILLFMDGQYFACARTSWPGRFVPVGKGDLHKWCEPFNQTLSEDSMIKTRLWYPLSQGIGIVLIILLTVAFGVYWKSCREEEQGGNYTPARDNNQDADMDNPEAIQITTDM